MDSTKKISKDRFRPRQQRIFNVELKKKLVQEIELKKIKVRDVVNLYRVSPTSVYKWLVQFSTTKINGARLVMESESLQTKTDKLLERISELERNVGRKQLEIEFLNKVIEICSKELGYDVKKKSITMQ
ncbi:MAG: transposase [Bacteroidota bacterium]|nr:transposase [Bacteroidota bacterium]